MIQRSQLPPEPRAQSALAASSVQGLRQVTVAQVNDQLCIRGSVASYYHKQLAQEIVRSVVSELEVVNTITVDERSRG